MSRTILTVPEAWREYTDGIDGGPAIQQLEQRWGARWRSSHKEMKFFCRRNIIYVYILEQLNKRPLDEILAELETMRNNSSLNALSNKLKKMKQESEKENTK
ncbi:transcriptional activator of glycolytic enzymes-domain-containing protein [Polychytrium aggregatum]|uniref:transcriptional activator of glycolytic enzymes-domain-containing protein n=1 Tax=Polychytrium aggregatum TaxID=110093 RepID=UPI0022FED435|nr:transcriptional activator of glycolytic enzymes-domain-containing protein [Polychytrium aggregatum]KAI9208022.1 transcriptional activator of glycolytic enzymes-domain-containing protein [Polychytrium aggregatum]